MSKCILLLLIACLSLSTNAQFSDDHHYRPKSLNQVQNQDPSLNDYDVKFYKLDLNMSHESVYIQGNVKAIVETRIDGFQEYVAQLDNDYSVDSVKYENTNIAFTHEEDLVVATLGESVSINELIEITIWYHGSLINVEPGFRGIWNQTTNGGITHTSSESFHAKEWWPCKEFLSDKADSLWVFVTVPEGIKVGSNGLLTNVEHLGDVDRYEWKH